MATSPTRRSPSGEVPYLFAEEPPVSPPPSSDKVAAAAASVFDPNAGDRTSLVETRSDTDYGYGFSVKRKKPICCNGCVIF